MPIRMTGRLGDLSARTLVVLAAGGSAALLLAALGFQYLGGLAPCVLCIWQRWPHLLALLAGLASWKLSPRVLAPIGLAGAGGSAAVGIFHTGVERGWWQGLKSCAGGIDLSKLSPDEALAAIMSAEVVRCDAVAWQMLDLSMASWNALASIALMSLWLRVLLKSQAAAG